ncbi:MAG TPA: hypothetical protein VFC31_08560 [Candidatus Limnocylindria bacterium]|nr:hypothetical protein [Candidatus Limnocylindria bacterium]
MAKPAGGDELTQLSSRYPSALADTARDYAREHHLPLRIVLAAALAEYLSRRADPAVSPTPHLHWRRGRPSGEVIDFQDRLMRVDGRGRKLRAAPKTPEVPWRGKRKQNDRDGDAYPLPDAA